MLRSNSKQSGGIHAEKPEERKEKAAVGRILRKRKVLSLERKSGWSPMSYFYKTFRLG